MVSAISTDIIHWEKALSTVATLMREEFKRQNPFEDDGEVSPSVVALRDAIHAFPVATDILLIDAGSARTIGHYANIFRGADALVGPIWTLIAHHVGELPTKAIKFHGTRALADLDTYLSLLEESFGLDERYRDSIATLAFSGCWTLDCSEIVDFVPFDIREQPEYYAKYLWHMLLGSRAEGLIDRFKKEIDYNELYGLAEDSILSLEELTKIDPTSACFINLLDDGQPPSIEERQEDVCGIQLIPKVPEDVRQTFRRAKDAYIFGYFKYDFFTVSVHYAWLALEAAIKARWSIGLPNKVMLSCGSHKAEMHFPSHTRILQFCRHNRWQGRTLLVDGQRFLFSSEALLDWLVRQRIVTKWERRGLRVGLDMRNALSHVEHSSTDMPASDKLRFAANLINKMFHNLP